MDENLPAVSDTNELHPLAEATPDELQVLGYDPRLEPELTERDIDSGKVKPGLSFTDRVFMRNYIESGMEAHIAYALTFPNRVVNMSPKTLRSNANAFYKRMRDKIGFVEWLNEYGLDDASLAGHAKRLLKVQRPYFNPKTGEQINMDDGSTQVKALGLILTTARQTRIDQEQGIGSDAKPIRIEFAIQKADFENQDNLEISLPEQKPVFTVDYEDADNPAIEDLPAVKDL